MILQIPVFAGSHHQVVSNSSWPHGLQHARLPCPSLSPGVCSTSCPLSSWCRPAISSSAAPFSFHPQSFPASGSFPVNQLFPSGGTSIGAPASASVLPMNIQGWFPLGLTGLISLLSKGLPRVFSSTTVWKYQFGTQPTLWPNSHIHTWLLEAYVGLILSFKRVSYSSLSANSCTRQVIIKPDHLCALWDSF